MGARQGHEAVLPAPVLLPPAGPQHREPAGPGGDRPHHGVLDAAGPLRVPRRRRAVPAADRTHRRHRRAPRSARLPRRPVGVPAATQRRGRPAGRGQPPLPRHDAVLRRPRRRRRLRRADDVLRLHRHAADVPVAGPRGRRTAGERSAAASRPARRRALGDVRAQPRRADARQAHRFPTRGGLRRVRTR